MLLGHDGCVHGLSRSLHLFTLRDPRPSCRGGRVGMGEGGGHGGEREERGEAMRGGGRGGVEVCLRRVERS